MSIKDGHWASFAVPDTRFEGHFGDRVVRCFAERPHSFHAMFEAALAAHPDRRAVIFEGRALAYRHLDAQVARIAAGLARHGVGKGDRVALFIGNRPEFITVLLATQRLGAIAVPVGVREQRPGLAYVLRHSGAMAIVFDAALAGVLPEASEAPALSLRICVDGDGDDTLAQLGRGMAPLATAVSVHEEDTAVLLYTSGTTGNPKGAMLSHLNIVHSALHYQACFGLSENDCAGLAVPASHVTGLIAVIAAMLRVGGAMLVFPQFHAADFIAGAAREGMSYTLMVPAMYNLCLLRGDMDAHDLSAWRIGGFGGAPMPPSTVDAMAQKLPGLALINAYGATETTSPATAVPIGATVPGNDSVGVALPCASVIVVDDYDVEVPRGVSGELWIGGPMVVRGYWDNPDATALGFTAGYWHSGDIGSMDEQGYVRIFDRKKDMLNRGGYKIYSAEVENVLMALPGVLEAAVVGRPCPVLGERVHAFVYAPGGTLDAAAVQAHCAARLADYKVPEEVTLTDAPLPRNANGKLLKRTLRERAAAEPPQP
jgi:O-succinylbenzoic acid--CoA ligase